MLAGLWRLCTGQVFVQNGYDRTMKRQKKVNGVAVFGCAELMR
jgi:hypothetical protein